MTAVSSLYGASSAQSLQQLQAMQARENRPQGTGGAIEVAAKALGLSTDQVVSRLQSGSSLADIAGDQDVSRDDLAAALKAGAPSALATADDADQVIDAIIDRVGLPQGGPQGPRGPGGPGGPQGPPPPPPPSSSQTSGLSVDGTTSGVYGSSLTADQSSMLDTLSDLLGTDRQTLLDKLTSGDSLSDLIASSNVSEKSLASVLQDGLLFDARV